MFRSRTRSSSTCSQRIKIKRSSPHEIQAKQGSQLLTRLIGGWFVDPENFPKALTIRLSECPTGCQIDLRIEETMGFGILDANFKRRYEDCFAQKGVSSKAFMDGASALA